MKRVLSLVLVLMLCAAISGLPAFAAAGAPSERAGSSAGVRISANEWLFSLKDTARSGGAIVPKAMTSKKFKTKITPKNGTKIPLGKAFTVKIATNSREFYESTSCHVEAVYQTDSIEPPIYRVGDMWWSGNTAMIPMLCQGNPGDKHTITVWSTDAKGKKHTHAKVTWTVAEVAVKKVTLPNKKVTLKAGQGEPFYVGAGVEPADATNQNITYSSSNKKVAAVDKYSGLVTPLKAGKAKITAKAANGKKAVCTVTVKKNGDSTPMPAYRALLFSNAVYDYNSNLLGQTESVRELEAALNSSTLYPWESPNPAKWNTRLFTNLTAKQMAEEVARLKTEVTGEGDATLIYFGGYNMGLSGVNDTEIQPELLVTYLAAYSIPGEVWLIFDGSAAPSFKTKAVTRVHTITANFEQAPTKMCAPLAHLIAQAGTAEDSIMIADGNSDHKISFAELEGFVRANIDQLYEQPVADLLQFSCGGFPESTYLFGLY